MNYDAEEKAEWYTAFMGYLVCKLPYKSRPWKVQYVSYKGGKRQIADLAADDLARLGFHDGMTLEQAKIRKGQLNAQEHLKRTEEVRQRVKKRLGREELSQLAYLAEEDVRDFEEEVLYARFGAEDFTKRNKLESHWRVAKRVICKLRIDPPDWEYKKLRFYDYFSKEQYSPAYLQKIIRILNLWGKFHSRKYRKFFEPLPYPVGYEKEKIADRYYEKNEAGLASDPLTPKQLQAIGPKLNPALLNWLTLSVWFGLRPAEVDALANPSHYRIERHSGTPVLFVYQSKLLSLPRDKRWKPIPCVTPEQKEALKLISQREFRRPLCKTVRSYFGERTTLYGGRKGFTDLMLSYGQRLEDISIWMGHTTIDRTWKSYKDKQSVRFVKIA